MCGNRIALEILFNGPEMFSDPVYKATLGFWYLG